MPLAMHGATPLIVGVTSHRNLVAGEIDGLRHAVAGLFRELRQRFPDLPLLVLSALAEGGDRLVAEEALACGARLMAVLPLPPEQYAEDFVEPGSREAFARLRASGETVQIPLLPHNTFHGVSSAGSQRDAQYAEAGVFIASHCHILLAVWDGRESDLTGGTAQIVRYHLEGVMPGSIDRRSSSRPLFDRGDESLVCHVACSRQNTDGTIAAPQAPLQAGETQWLCQDNGRTRHASLPPEFEEMFRHMTGFNLDMDRYREEIAGQVPRQENLPGSHESGPGQGIGTTSMLFHASDWLAIHFQRRVLLAMRGIHVLAVLMGFAFIAYSDMPGDLFDIAPMIYAFILFFASGFVLDRLAKRRAWHRKYIDYRALAEGLRVQRYWLMAGVASDQSVAFAHDNFMQKQDVELGWIRNVMRVAGLERHQGKHPSATEVDAVIDDWIGHPNGGGQLGYYARKGAERTRIAAAASRIGNICLWIGLGIGLVLAVFHRWLNPDLATILVAVIGLLALIAAARESYTYRKADRELIKQYRFMHQLFASARRALDAETTARGKREILRALGEASLAEHAEWALMHRERPLEHGRL